MGLRLREGVDLRHLAELTGLEAEALIDGAAVERLQRQGLVLLEGSSLRATAAGMLLLDAILAEIVNVAPAEVELARA